MKLLKKTAITIIATALLLSGCQNSGNDNSSTSNGMTESQEVSTVSEPKKIERPFEPIQRPELLADKMEAKCDPLVKGDFIQPWFCKDWTVQKWNMYFSVLKKAGIEFVILQNTSDRENGKFTSFVYPSGMADDKTLSTDNVSVSTYTIKNMMEAAKQSGISVYLGIGGDNQWWSYAFKNLSWCEKEAELANRCATELYNLYKAEYPDTFVGWYWTWEMFSAKDKYEINWAKMVSITLDHLTTLDPTMPCIFSPFYSSYEEPSLERVSEQWTYFMENTSFRDGDIFCPQDNIGIHSKDYGEQAKGAKYDITFMENVVRALHDAAEKNPKVRFWLNVENFNDGKSASIARYADQMDIASKYAEKLMTFSYAHYYNPLNVDPSYNKAYLAYKEWVEANKAEK